MTDTSFTSRVNGVPLLLSQMPQLGVLKKLTATPVTVNMNSLTEQVIYTTPGPVPWNIPYLLVASNPQLTGFISGTVTFKAGWSGGAANQFGSGLVAAFTTAFQLGLWVTGQSGVFTGFGGASQFAVTPTILAVVTSLTADFDLWGLQF